jgi:hypothetical protein
VSLGQQFFRDIFAGVSKCAGDGMSLLIVHSFHLTAGYIVFFEDVSRHIWHVEVSLPFNGGLFA